MVALAAICAFSLSLGASRAVAQSNTRKDIPSYPIWSIVQLALDELSSFIANGGGGSGGPFEPESIPPYEIKEDDKSITITFCVPNPDDHEKQICTTLKIDKETGNIKIIVKDYTFLPLTFHVKCRPNGICKIVDDLPGPLETVFCKTSKDDQGRIILDCDFDYMIFFKFKGIIKIYIEDGQLCSQTDNRPPKCIPIDKIPADLQDLWRRLEPPYLPKYPTPIIVVPTTPEPVAETEGDLPICASTTDITNVCSPHPQPGE